MSDKNSIDEKPLRASPQEYNKFMNSVIWYDMRTTLEDRLNLLQDQLIMSPNDTINDIIALKSEMKSIKDMLALPKYLKACAHKEQSKK